eukprot:TRINITY_DN4195_c0_g1_i1.p1 TRINITY_DN4195_c0_g1~~TRINITY_DN4195_c0_g1_i1.p1  ORF type:complete len:242 (+),score=32.54 TRINITY_DN4195_c0_g1_i1:68-793(+)
MESPAVDQSQKIASESSPAPLMSAPLIYRAHEEPSELQWMDNGGSGECGGNAKTDGEKEAGVGMGIRQRAMQMFYMAKGMAETSWRGMRGWRDFADRSKFNPPNKMDALSRAKVNLVYFKSNYMFLMGILTVWTVLSNIMFTLSMVASGCAWKIYFEFSDGGRNTVHLAGDKQLRPIEAYVGLAFLTFLLFYFTGGSSTVFWLVTTCIIVILGHATMREAAATQAELALEELSRPDDTDWV